MRFAFWADSHVGHVRGNNEDSAFAGPHMVLVADGVGGQAAGEIASASVAFVMSAISMSARGSLTADPSDLLEVLSESIAFANRHLADGVASNPARSGMATTLSTVLTDGHKFALAHVGDSCVYLLRDRQLTKLTKDHTLVQSLVDAGQITPAQARVHPHRSVVTRNVSGSERTEPDLVLLDLQAGDRLLLCSDGLTDFVPDERVAMLLADSSPKQAVQDLISAGLDAGGYDNITCVVGDIEPGELMPWNRRPYHCRMHGAVADPSNLIDPTVHAHAA